MINPDHFAVTFARAAHLIRTSPDVAQQKAALRALVALTKLGSITVLVREGTIEVEGQSIAPALPLVTELIGQLERHGVTTISFSKGAPPSEVLNLLKRLAADPDTDNVEELAEYLAAEWRGTGVFVTLAGTSAAEAFDHEVPVTRAPPLTSLAAAMRRLAASPHGDDVLDRLNAVGVEVQHALEADRLEEAIQALSAVIGLEGKAPNDHVRRCYGITLRRGLTRGILQKVTGMLQDSRYGDAASRVLRRAGADGTKVLVDQINSQPTMQERRISFGSLRDVDEGYHLMVSMLRHPDWYVVRNSAWLVGELGIREVVPELAMALEHRDGRVRQAAAVALAKVGTPETLGHLSRLLTEGDPRLRRLVLTAVQGPEATALVRPLASILEREKDPKLATEYVEALGRIRTPDAVAILMRTAHSGRWFGRRPKPVRLAAIDALRRSRYPAVLETLEELVRDRDRDVQEAAREALAELREASQ